MTNESTSIDAMGQKLLAMTHDIHEMLPHMPADLLAQAEALQKGLAMLTAALAGVPDAPVADVAAEHKIKIEFGSYNDRRYGKPWCGRITAWTSGRPAIEWGEWYGSAGDGGYCEITALTGDIVRYGQKDTRNPNRTCNRWCIVESDGTLREVTEAEARDHWTSK